MSLYAKLTKRVTPAITRIVASILVFTVCAATGAQSGLTKQEAAVRRKADTLQPRDPISVIRVDAPEQYGTFLSKDDTGLTFYDIDLKLSVTLAYADIKKIKNGYGGYNTIQHRHTDRTRGLIVVGVAIAALGGLLAAVATAKD